MVPDLINQSGQLGKDPAVERVVPWKFKIFAGRFPTVDPGIGCQKGQGIPERKQQGPGCFHQSLFGKTKVFTTNSRAVEHVKPNRVGSILIQHLCRIGVVLEPLAHLLPVFSQDQPVDDTVVKCGFVKKSLGDDHEGVKPAPGLVQSFADEVGREICLKNFLVFKWIMLLPIGHRARLKPAVEHLRHPPVGLSLVFNHQLVNMLFMKVRDLGPGCVLEFFHAAEAKGVSILTFPDRQGRAPESVAADRPIPGVFKPLAKTSVADVTGNPMHFTVVLHHPVPEGFDLDKPGGDRLIDQRGIGPPAERITVLHGLLPEHQSLFLQFLGNGTVGFHHIQSCDELHVLHEISLLIHRVENRNSFAVENPHVIFTETGEVDEACAAFIADILVVVNFPCVIRRLPFLREIEQRLIRPAF